MAQVQGRATPVLYPCINAARSGPASKADASNHKIPDVVDVSRGKRHRILNDLPQ